MKSDEQMIKSLMDRRDEYNIKRNKRSALLKSMVKGAVSVCGTAAVVFAVIALQVHNINERGADIDLVGNNGIVTAPTEKSEHSVQDEGEETNDMSAWFESIEAKDDHITNEYSRLFIDINGNVCDTKENITNYFKNVKSGMISNIYIVEGEFGDDYEEPPLDTFDYNGILYFRLDNYSLISDDYLKGTNYVQSDTIQINYSDVRRRYTVFVNEENDAFAGVILRGEFTVFFSFKGFYADDTAPLTQEEFNYIIERISDGSINTECLDEFDYASIGKDRYTYLMSYTEGERKYFLMLTSRDGKSVDSLYLIDPEIGYGIDLMTDCWQLDAFWGSNYSGITFVD